jgi:hypothetical protein
MESLFKLIKALITNRFNGELVIRFANGKVIIIKKTESIKIISD